MNVLLLDCDGTIREPIEGKWIDKPENQKLISGSERAIAHYYRRNWLIIGVTNQGGVAAGHKSLENCIAEQLRTLEMIPQMNHLLFCPDFAGSDCYLIDPNPVGDHDRIVHYSRDDFPTLNSFRKPGTGMIQLVLNGCKEPPCCWFVGDREEDALCAAAAGVNFMWADIWRDRFSLGIGETNLAHRNVSRQTLMEFLGT